MWEKTGPGHRDRYRCVEYWDRTQVTGMWEDQDRDIGDTENKRGTWSRTEGYQNQDNDMDDCD